MSQFFRKLIFLLALLSLAACSDGAKEEARSVGSPEVIAPAVEVTDAPASVERGGLPMPNLELGFPYVVKSDSTFIQKNTGQLRRALVLGFSEGTIEEKFAATSASLAALGFVTRADPTISEERISQSFYGRGGAYLEVRELPVGEDGLIGEVGLSWPIKSEEDPVPLFQEGRGSGR